MSDSASNDPTPLRARALDVHEGSPIVPIGDGLTSGLGPGAWARDRSDRLDVTVDGEPKILPLRATPDVTVSPRDVDPRGFTVVGADGEAAGTVVDLWTDRSEPQIRYFELKTRGGRRVLLPLPFAKISNRRGEIRVNAIKADQFELVPTLGHPDRISLLEEDRISAFYGGGLLYADARRAEPWL